MADLNALYSYQGQEPQPLPHEISWNGGYGMRYRTGVESFTEEEIEKAGYTGPYEKPTRNPDDLKSTILSWNSENLTYEILEIDYETLLDTFLKEVNRMIEYSEVTTPETIFCSEEKITELQNFYDYLIELRDNPPPTRDELLSLPKLKRPSYEKLSDDVMNLIISGMSTCNSVSEINELLVSNNIHLNYIAEEDINLIIDTGSSILNITQ